MLLASPGDIPISFKRLSKNGCCALYRRAEFTTLSAKDPFFEYPPEEAEGLSALPLPSAPPP